jgi:hypothetical protein
VLPPASGFYRSAPHPTLRQGDVVLAPTSRLWSPERVDQPIELAPPSEHLGSSVLSLPWLALPDARAPLAIHQTRWSPALVLSHDCELEKDFNERVHELLATGWSEEEARAAASADPDLDPLAVVAPLLAYGELPQHRHEGIRSGQRSGYFPLPAISGAGPEEYAVDLFHVSTVDVLLLTVRVASLSEEAAGVLRYKLSEAYASRDLSVLIELEALVGQRVTSVQALPKSRKKTALVLVVESGETYHLEIRRPRDELPAEITRLPPNEP